MKKKANILGRVSLSLGVILVLTFLVSAGDVTVRSGTMNVADNFIVDASGNVQIIGDTDIFGDANIASDVDVSGNVRFASLVGCDTIDTDVSGNLVCGSDNAGPGGDITEVQASLGLAGGGTSGSVTLRLGTSNIASPVSSGSDIAGNPARMTGNWANCPLGSYVCGVRIECLNSCRLEVRCCG